MRSYGQYCGLARSLDVLGERWSLLVVRELLGGPARYGELAAALPGVATNLLADRLRTLTSAGVVERQLQAESGAVVYALTAWGEELREPIEALVRWSTPLMVTGRHGDAFRTPRLTNALRGLLRDRAREEPVVVGLRVHGTLINVRIDSSGISVEPAGETPQTVLEAEPEIALGLAAGVLSPQQATGLGRLTGAMADLEAVFGPASNQAP